MSSLLQSMHSVFVLTLLALYYLNSVVLAQQTNNPVNGSAPIAPWSLILEDVVQLPNSARPEYLIGNPTTGLNYVIDQRGPIYSLDPNVVNPTLTLFLDLGSVLGSLHTGNESGVRGLAFHPDFSQQGTLGYRKMYTSLSRNRLAPAVGNPVVFDSPGSTDHWTIVGEWDVNANGTVDTNSYRELMRIEQPFSNHNAGHIGFNPAADVSDIDYGNLYIAIGDGGSGGGPFDLSLDIDMTPASYPHGKILRINPLTAGGDPYSVPGDNPFVGQADRVEEVWAYGLRNPHKFAWDSVTGEMYISDIGQGTVEEVSVGQTGANYGWNEREGAFVYVNGGAVSNLPADHPSDSFTYPVAQYDHKHTNGITGHGAAIVGGPVYRGSAIPELDGVYLFADFSNNPGPIFAVGVDDLVERDDFTSIEQLDGGRLSPFEEVKIRDDGMNKDFRQFLRDANNANYTRTDTRWGVGTDGDIFIMSKRDGSVRRVARVVVAEDFNANGLVDFPDFVGFSNAFGMEATGDRQVFDLDGSLVVDFPDFIRFANAFQPANGGVASVPEPSTLGLFSSVGCLFLVLRKR